MKIAALVVYASYLVSFVAGGLNAAVAETRVSGSVRDASGSSVAHASVEAIPVLSKDGQGTVGNRLNPWVAADSNGTFNLNLAPGRYRIRAKAEMDGYPDPSFWVNLDPRARFPEVTVADKEVQDVEVILGRKGGILSGAVRDAQTRKPLAGVKIRIQDARNANAYVEIFTDGTGHFLYTVPSKALLISAAAPGYKVNVFENGSEVIFSPGEHREFQLEMEHE